MNIRESKKWVFSSILVTTAAILGFIFIPKITQYSTASIAQVEEDGINFFDIEFAYAQ